MNAATMTTTKAPKNTKKSRAEIVKEVIPIPGGKVHGVTFDGKLVWYARDTEIVGFDPDTNEVVQRLAIPAESGTAFDGKHLYQLAAGKIRVISPSDGRVIRELPAPPGKANDNSGMAYADGYLWVGQWRNAKIHQIDAKTGEVVKTLSSDRFVTGVSCVDGAVWHGVSNDGSPSELRRLAQDGTVEEVITFEEGVHVSGVESNGKGAFWCGGEAGKLRLVREGIRIA
jgi:outer membrane protein assembly factor BamB